MCRLAGACSSTSRLAPLPTHPLRSRESVTNRYPRAFSELGRRATAQAAADVLDRLAERMPFVVRAISIDNGSESMAEFETACEARGIALFVLPPRSPKLHGAVERANRTHTEEFYEVTTAEPDLPSLQAELASGRPSTTQFVQAVVAVRRPRGHAGGLARRTPELPQRATAVGAVQLRSVRASARRAAEPRVDGSGPDRG